MDPIRNPFAPGAGAPPPELAGREALLESTNVALARIRAGRHAKSIMLIGLRGVGKTVLLDRIRIDAEASGIHTIRVEAPESRSLPAILAPQLRQALIRLSSIAKAKSYAMHAMRALAGFVKGLKAKYQDIEVSLDVSPEPGLADNGDLEYDLQVLLETVGIAAREADTALALFIDELQYVEEPELASLITALHRASQLTLPIVLVGAGLPQLAGRLGKAKSYAERLFEFQEIGALDNPAAAQALSKPVEELGVAFEHEAISAIIRETSGYPYFLQEWGKHSWDVASKSPITHSDVKEATVRAIAALDDSFFRVRFDRLTPNEKRFLRAMAELGPGPHRSGDIADILNRSVSTIAPTRAQLIRKGMLWSPSHGDTAFTVPRFDEFMKRMIPGDDWRTN